MNQVKVVKNEKPRNLAATLSPGGGGLRMKTSKLYSNCTAFKGRPKLDVGGKRCHLP